MEVWREELYHALMGQEWKKHKYLYKEGDRYIYPEDLEAMRNAAREAGTNAYNAVKEAGTNAYNKAREVGGKVYSRAKEVGSNTYNRAREVGGNAYSSAKSGASDLYRRASEAYGKGKSELKGAVDRFNKSETKYKIDNKLGDARNAVRSAYNKVKYGDTPEHYKDNGGDGAYHDYMDKIRAQGREMTKDRIKTKAKNLADDVSATANKLSKKASNAINTGSSAVKNFASGAATKVSSVSKDVYNRGSSAVKTAYTRSVSSVSKAANSGRSFISNLLKRKSSSGGGGR